MQQQGLDAAAASGIFSGIPFAIVLGIAANNFYVYRRL